MKAVKETVEKEERNDSMYFIRPYIQPGASNMGLERYDDVLHEGTFQEEELTAIELFEGSNVWSWMNGLNEESMEIRNISDATEKSAAIAEIRKTAAHFEKIMKSNVVDVTDKDFWSKITFDKVDPTNPRSGDKFWSSVRITVDNFAKGLDTRIPKDLILINCIKAGGFSLIARNLSEAENSVTTPKFYLDEVATTTAHTVAPVIFRNKAIATLTDLFELQVDKMQNVASLIQAKRGKVGVYNSRTPNELFYLDLNRFITGETAYEKVAFRASKEFMEYCGLDPVVLRTNLLTHDGIARNTFILRADSKYYHFETDTLLGADPKEIVAMLSNPINAELLKRISDAYNREWTRV